MKNFEEINRTFTVKTNSILQGLRLGQKVSKGFRKWLKDKMGKCVNCAKSVMQIFAESAESAKPIFATFATFASAIFVGKESNESTVRYALWSRISLTKPLQNPYKTLTRFRLSLGSNLSRLCLASLICLCMLTVGVGNVWGAEETWSWTASYSSSSFSTSSFTLEGITWTSSIAGTRENAGTSGSPIYVVQVAKNNGCTLTTSDISGTITSISVESLSSAQKTLTVKVGDSYTSKAKNIGTSSYDAVSFSSINASGTIQLIWSTSTKALRVKSITINYTTGSSCAKAVTPVEGTKTNVSAMTFSSESVATCSETAADRQVTVTITPASCYTVPSSTRLTPTGTSADYVSGPTDNGNGTYSFVYQFAKDATGTSTFSASLSTKTTYTVQYNAGATTCTGGNAITGSHADDTKTCGTNLTLPGETFHATGYTQTGWTKSSCGSQTNGLGGSYTSNAEQTFYPVWTVNSYTVTWMVNGEEYTAGGSTSVNYGSHVATLPTAPTPSCGDKFMGWTTTNIGSVGQATDEGLNLFTTAGGAPTISAEGDVTYYAVFADEE